MPTDWLFYWMTRPWGLLLIAGAIAILFGIWRFALGSAFISLGHRPFALACIFAAVGLVVLNFGSSYLEFSSRVNQNVLPEEQRWSIVPEWTIYMSTLALTAVLPLIGLLGIPVSAVLLRYRRFSLGSIAIILEIAWLALALLGWAFPSNEWHRTHRLESLLRWLKDLGPSVVLVGLPFFAGILVATHRYRNAET